MLRTHRPPSTPASRAAVAKGPAAQLSRWAPSLAVRGARRTRVPSSTQVPPRFRQGDWHGRGAILANQTGHRWEGAHPSGVRGKKLAVSRPALSLCLLRRAAHLATAEERRAVDRPQSTMTDVRSQGPALGRSGSIADPVSSSGVGSNELVNE
eukprot:scaffold3749_cov457-Prasinococcus_capsulatus_cf.AAC.5